MDEQQRPLGWTTIEESERLVEAGIDLETHDMYYNKCVRNPISRQSQDVLLDTFRFQMGRKIPCWSLGALISLLPPIVTHNRYSLKLITDGNFIYYRNENKLIRVSFLKDGLIFNAVDAVIWCLENGYIKKGE